MRENVMWVLQQHNATAMELEIEIYGVISASFTICLSDQWPVDDAICVHCVQPWKINWKETGWRATQLHELAWVV